MITAYLTEIINMQYEVHVFFLTEWSQNNTTFKITSLLSALFFFLARDAWSKTLKRNRDNPNVWFFQRLLPGSLGFIFVPLIRAEKGRMFWSCVCWSDAFCLEAGDQHMGVGMNLPQAVEFVEHTQKMSGIGRISKKRSSERLNMLESFSELM